MHLLSLNLQKSSAINIAVYGNFSGPKAQEIIVAKGSSIELFRPDDSGNRSICRTPVFSIIRSMITFRLLGSNKDFIVIGSDSGKITIAEYDMASNDFKLIHNETFGKSGCRRIVPGQYLACDPKGRAIMIAGVEKQKFVYVMSRDSANRTTISSPLEAHKSETILFSVVGVDVGFEHPIFAMIELEYTEADQDSTGEAIIESEKRLTFYELDLGLNHVVRKWSEPISRTSNLLLSVPGGDDGPSGVLMCGENWISYKNQGHDEIRAVLPRRIDMPVSRGLLITSGTVHKQKDLFFFMLQSELGDLYKATLVLDPNDCKIVTDLVISVFDTIQLANSLCITKTGLLFVASEFGNHGLFEFQGIGDDPNAVKSSKIVDQELNEELGDDSESAASVAPTFKPSEKLSNLALVDDINSLAPITDMLVEDLIGDDSNQIYTLCGRGNRSSLRILKHGVSVTEMAVSELPGRPNAVWTVRASQDSPYDKFIVVSFANATLVLSIGDTIEEVTESGFLASAPTLQIVLLADNALLQVHSNGIRHIRTGARTSEWKTPQKKIIERATANSRQVAISLAGGEIIYFELDAAGLLMEMGTQDLGKEVSSLDMGIIPDGRSRSLFLSVGCWDDTVQLLSLDPNDVLSQRASMSLPARPDSLCLIEMIKESSGGPTGDSGPSTDAGGRSQLFLNIGLANGVLVRVEVDQISGTLSDSRQRFLGPKSIKLFRVMVQGQLGVLALTSRAWLMYNFQGRYFQQPVSYEALEYVSNFVSEQCPEGIVAVSGNFLRIFTVDNLGSTFNQTVYPLRYTPRKMCSVSNTKQIVIIETDHNEYNEAERAQMTPSSDTESMETTNIKVDNAEEEDDEDEESTIIPVRGPLPPVDGKWASCIRVIEPSSGDTKDLLELNNNEAAFSVCTCRFLQHSEETFIIVGTTKDLTLHPRKTTASYINVYRLLDGKLQLIHKTEVEDLPMSLCEFQGKLLVGIGKCLRLFELGKKKLLRKCENRLFPTSIVKLQVSGDRIYVGDLCDSIHYVKYRRQENVLTIFADDVSPRFMTALTVLDYDTVGGSDKFGNIFVMRLPEGTSDDIDTGTKQIWDQGYLNGAATKTEVLTHYYLGEAVTGITKCSLIVGGPEVMLVTTVMGGIYVFLSFSSKEDISFYQHLEMYLRQGKYFFIY
jgi:splicing factor 3B subunit 3